MKRVSSILFVRERGLASIRQPPDRRPDPKKRILFVVALVWIGTVGNAKAATSTWQAVSAGYWTNASLWSPSAVPGAADDVIFNSGSAGCTVDVDIVINSLNVTNSYSGTITFTEGTSADLTISNDFYLGSSATIIPTYSSTNGDGTGRVITVKGNAVIDGTINGYGKGFPKTQGPGGSSGNGGSYGGVGASGPATYGSLTQPTALGSGGRDYPGGGAIKLSVTGTLTLNGSITVDGGGDNGSGAGGSIWLVADTFTGNGTISSDGGGGWKGGGGGRVSIEHTNSTWTGTVSVAGGTGGALGQPGTLWYSKMFPISGDVVIDTSYQYYFPNLTTNYWNLTITNGSWVEFHQGNLAITNLVMKDNSLLTFDGAKLGTRDFDMTNLWIKGSINISNSTVYLPAEGNYDLQGDLNLSTGATLYALGDTNAINAASGGSTGTPHGVGVTIDIGGDANIEGTIDGDFNGFAAKQGPGGSGNGGSYGGVGGNGPATYGSLTQPTALGSGGRDYAGGSAIKLNVTGTLALNGSITADGKGYNGSGAGGSIWLLADMFTGNGTISADGASGGVSWRGGGGGRVSIECSTSTWTGTVSVAGGPGTYVGQPGTLWYSKMFPISGDVIIDTGYQYYFPNLTTNYWNLTITNGTWVEFHQGNLVITNLLVQDSSLLTFDGKKYGTRDFDMTNLWIKGSINISNSTVYLPAQGSYDLSGDFNLLSTGSTLYALGDTNAINEASGGTNGGPHGVGVTIDIGGDANIEGTIDGDGLGFPPTQGPGGTSGGNSASHGGVGNNSPATYGSLTQPTALGSGGRDPAGGGAIKLSVTGILALNGSITADGKNAYCGGSGGSIWLIADTFTGNGTISADGGNWAAAYGGGGGRVSIEYSSSTWTGTVSVAGGTGITSVVGCTGTYFLCESVCLGAGSLGCNGITLASDLSKDGGGASATNGVKLTRFVTIWSPYRPRLCWRDTSTDLGTNQLDNVAIYDLSGLPPNTKHKIYYDGQWTNTLTSDASGNLTNIVITLDAEHTILVEGPARGTAIMIM